MMPSLPRPSSLTEEQQDCNGPLATDHSINDVEALLLAEAEAEAAEAEALAAAARARAGAIRLRQQSEVPPSTPEPPIAEVGSAGASATEEDTKLDDTAGDEPDYEDSGDNEGTFHQAPAGAQTRRLSYPRWKNPLLKVAALAAAVAYICALAGLSGYMVWHHQRALRAQQSAAEFAAAARQSVVALFSLDYHTAKSDLQRIIDNSTGQFRDDIKAQSDELAKMTQESKVHTEAHVHATAVQSESKDSAVVLIAATTTLTSATSTKKDPTPWRLSASMVKDAGQIKMSKLEFVP